MFTKTIELIKNKNDNGQTVRMAPHMELMAIHYYTGSRKYSQSVNMTIWVEGLGEIDFKDGDLSQETKNAIQRDAMAAMQKKLGY